MFDIIHLATSVALGVTAFLGVNGTTSETPAAPETSQSITECLEDMPCWDSPTNPNNNLYNDEEPHFNVEEDAWDAYSYLGFTPETYEDGFADSYVGSYNSNLPELHETQFTVDSLTTPDLVHIFEVVEIQNV